MPQIVDQGSINTTALVVPDLYIQIVPPQNLYLNGVPTNIVGMVGTAAWGPIGQPVTVSTMADYAVKFGTIQNRKYDLGTAAALAVQQGAQDFRCVRVTDGTDTVAVTVFGFVQPGAWQATHAYSAFNFQGANGAVWQVQSTGTSGTNAPNPSGVAVGGTFSDGVLTWKLIANNTSVSALAIVGLYTGSYGNSIRVSLAPGSKSGTWKLVIAPPGAQPEVFDNIPTTGLFWANMQDAVNNGQIAYGRGPSQFVMATGGGGGNAGAAPVLSSTWNGTDNANGTGILTGMISGTDGAYGVTGSSLIGVDTMPRRGMYALRGTGVALGVLADLDDLSTSTTQAAFGRSEGCLMIGTGPAGDTITNAVSVKGTTGLDDYGFKYMFGDWLYWTDIVNGKVRLVSPQGMVAGRYANLSPQNSALNKQLFSIIGSQKSGLASTGQSTSYSQAELSQLFSAGIDVICNPQPGGKYWGVRYGHNSSSNPAISGDTYTRMTFYIAKTLASGMGIYVGETITPTLFQRIRATQIAFLQAMLSQGMIGTLDGSLPYGVICDTSNNPQSRTSLGYVQCDTQVVYLGINEKFILNIEGGQTVTVTKQTLPSGQ